MHKIKKTLKLLIKIFVSFALLLFVLSKIDTQKLILILQEINPSYLFLALLFFNLSKIISSIRLNNYFADLNIDLDQKRALILYYVGMFYNLFLPGGIGGDGYKIYLLNKHHNTTYKDLIQAHLLDRLSGLAALLFLCSLLILFSSFTKLYPFLKIAALLSLFLIYPLFLSFHIKLFKKFSQNIIKTTLLGLLVQLLQLLSALFLLFSLSIPHIIDYLTLFLFSSVVAILPLTIGGVGAREFTFLYGLKLLNFDPTSGIAFSFLFFLLTLLSSAIGVLFIHKPL